MKQIQTKIESVSRLIRETALASSRNETSQRTQSNAASGSDKRDKEPIDVLTPEAFESKQELVKETGMCPHEYFLEILEAHDGRLSQQEIGDYTGWSSSTVSCLLGRMDDQGQIVRIRLGREKFVYLPDAVPEVREIDKGDYRSSTFDRLQEP